MFLLFNSLVASLDGLIIGINIKLAQIKITKLNIFLLTITNILVYILVLSLYTYFNLTIITKNIATIIYLCLALNTLKSKTVSQSNLKITHTLLLGLSHSLDGSLISLNFAYQYNIFIITLLFSFMSIFILLLGYSYTRFFKQIKKGQIISAFLFLILAFLNYFF